jgi:hypothetical protein
MTSVWVLVLAVGIRNGGGPTIIDNIVTKEECVRISEVLFENVRGSSSLCVEVRKVKQ